MNFDLGQFAESITGESDRVELQRRADLVYRELKRVAHRALARSSSATLDTTGLVHETYLKLAGSGRSDPVSRHHFFALAAKAMRQIVIDLARADAAAKRGGADRQQITLERAGDIADELAQPDLIKLDDALRDLQERQPELAELVELRFFAGLTMEQIADVRGVSPRTLDREWRRAKSYLYTALHADG